MSTVYADVVTRIDERAAQAAADQLREQFSQITASIGSETSDKLGEGLKANLPKVGNEAADGFMAGFRDGVAGEIGPVAASLNVLSTLMSGVGASGAAAGLSAAAGIAGIAVAAGAVGRELYDVGVRFDAMESSVAAATGRMGANLDALSESIRNVAAGSASSLEAVGNVGAQVATAFNLSGAPMEALISQVDDLDRVTGQSLDVRQFGMTLRAFGEDGSQAQERLDALAQTAAGVGIPLNEFVTTLGNAGPAAQALGIGVEGAVNFIVAMDRAGVDADKTIGGLNRAVSVFAEHNIDLQTGLQATIGQIRGMITAGDELKAVALATDVFGNRNAATAFVNAIRQGKLSVEELQKSLGDTDNYVEKLKNQTENWNDKWDVTKAKVRDLANEIGDPLRRALDSVLSGAIDKLNEFLEGVPGSYNTRGSREEQLGRRGLGSLYVPDGGGPQGPSIIDQSGRNAATQRQRMGLPSNLDLPDIAAALADDPTGGAAQGLPRAPVLPYDSSYGQPPMPGETQEQWRARMSNLAAEHDLAERRARLSQLEASGNATAEDVIAAKNDVIEAEMRAWQTEQSYLETRRVKAAEAAQLPYGAGYLDAPRPGQTAQQYSAETSFLEAQRKAAQADADFERAKASGTATTADLATANNNLVEARRAENQALLRLQEAYQQTNEKASQMTAKLGDVGAALDDDLGISKGLSGIADNLTRFLANLAFAPVLGALRGVQEGNGGYNAGAMGSGLAGLMGLSAGMGAQPRQQVAAAPALAMPYFPPYAPGYTTPQGNDGGGGFAPMGTPFGAVPSGMAAGINLSTIPVAAQKYANDCIDASARIILSASGVNMSEEQLMNIIPPGGSIDSLASGLNQLAPQGGFKAMAGSGGNQQAMFDAIKSSIDSGVGSILNVAPGSSIAGQTFAPGHYIAATGYNPDGTINVSDTAGGRQYSVTAADAFQATRGRGIVAGTGVGQSMGREAGRGSVAGLPAAAASSRFGAAELPGPGAADPSQSVMGGRAWGQGTPSSGGIGFGGSGLIGAASQAASMAGMAASLGAGGMDGGAGGAVASVAAQIGIQELQRGIAAMGQYAGNAVGGLMETFSLNDSALGDPSKSWLGKLVGVAAGVRPALPNSAGKEGGASNPNMAESGKQQPKAPGPLTPQQAEAAKADFAQNGATINNVTNNQIDVTNQRATEDYTGQVVQAHLGAQAFAGQAR